MLKFAFYAIMGFSLLLNAVGIASNFSGTEAAAGLQTPTPTASPTISPTATPVPTPCFPDDPRKPCPTPTPEPLPTTSPTMIP